MTKHILLFVAIALLSTAASASTFKLENGYFSISGSDGVVSSMRFDPAGKGQYGRNHILGFSVGDPIADSSIAAQVDQAAGRLILKGAKFANPANYVQENHNFPEQLTGGGSIGQSFVTERGFVRSVEALVPTWGTTESAVTLKLYRIDGGKRTEVAAKRFENLADNGWVKLEFPDQPAGTYLLEMSDLKGQAGWWSLGKDVIKGEAFLDGVAKPEADRCIHCNGYEVGSGDFEITLKANKLHSKFTPAPAQAGANLQHNIKLPWIKSGYDTTSDKIVFHHFLTSEGLYMPVHQFKRRPFSGVAGAWVLMSGRFGSDLKFTNAPIHLEFAEDSMTMQMPGGERDIELLAHTDKLPDTYPVFFSSDAKTDKVLNEFLLSHNFNFGVGTNSDWKDWHTLQLSWTANHQCNWQHTQFLDYKMSPNGYVHCWGADAGWPFPYKDDDKDGVNDYDSRHFTSNPCFILGAWREYCWNPDSDYLAKLMPRVRAAMGFMLREQDGDKGVLVYRNAPGHEGNDKGIGSNYWDISPFGWKDAFTNSFYYPSLEAMAQLEEAALRDPAARSQLASGPDVHTPGYYRRLAATVRKSYNGSFWLEDKGRYSGCVDIDGVSHDYGMTFVNLPAMAYGLADADQVNRIYNWMETGASSSGKADIYSRWVFAPRACSIHNPKREEPQTPVPSWWSMAWNGTGYDEQCQDGGAILYTSFHDILARARFLGADNAWKRFTAILDRYAEPDHLSGGNPLYRGESTQGGPGGSAGGVGVEGEFPESGLVPVSYLYAFLGIDADATSLTIRPNLPSALTYGGVRNLRYRGLMYDIKVTNSSVELKCTTKGHERVIRKEIRAGETFRYTGKT